MGAKKPKFYVVWTGRKTGVFNTWDECNTQIQGFKGAVFKSFPSKQLAEQAFRSNSREFIGKNEIESTLSVEELTLIGKPDLESISVDAAWNTSTGMVEYQGVDTRTKELIFRQGPYEDGTINIGEFLAIVHALAYCKQKRITLPIYTDSRTAISWVKYKRNNSNHPRSEKNDQLFKMMERAEKWLEENDYPNKILKWETKAWGEIPADFGRK